MRETAVSRLGFVRFILASTSILRGREVGLRTSRFDFDFAVETGVGRYGRSPQYE